MNDMISNAYEVDNQQRESCTVSIMRTMLEDYCNDTIFPLPMHFPICHLASIQNTVRLLYRTLDGGTRLSPQCF